MELRGHRRVVFSKRLPAGLSTKSCIFDPFHVFDGLVQVIEDSHASFSADLDGQTHHRHRNGSKAKTLWVWNAVERMAMCTPGMMS